MQEEIYPDGPAKVPPELTRPTAAYKRRAYLATLGVLLFVVGYAVLAGWFGWMAYRLLSSINDAPSRWYIFVGGGVTAAFLAILMVKAVTLLVRRSDDRVFCRRQFRWRMPAVGG